MTLAEELRDAIAVYRKADDRGDLNLRAAAYDRMKRLRDQIQAAQPRGQR